MIWVPGYHVDAVFVKRAQQTSFSKGELLLPLKTQITVQSQKWFGFMACRVVVTNHNAFPFYSTYPETSQNGSTFILFSIHRYGSDVWRRNQSDRIMQKGLSYYINNYLLLNPKGRAIKALTRTNRGQNGFGFRPVLWPSNVLLFRFMFCLFISSFFFPFYSRAYSAEHHASKICFK